MPFYQFGLNPNQKDDLTEYVLDYMQSTTESVNVGGDLVVKGNIEVDGSVTMSNLQLDLTTDEVEETTTKKYLTNSAQTITGEKTFDNGVVVKDGGSGQLSVGINANNRIEIKSNGPVIEINKQENTRMTFANSETVLWEQVVIANREKTDNGQVNMVTHPALTLKMNDGGEVNTDEVLGELKFNVVDAGDQTAASIRAVATTAFSDAPPKEYKAPTKLTFHTEGNLVQEFTLSLWSDNDDDAEDWDYSVDFYLANHGLSDGDVVDVDYKDATVSDTTLPGIWTVIYDSANTIRLHKKDENGVFQEFKTPSTNYTINNEQIWIKQKELDKERLVIDGDASTITMNDPLTVNGAVTATSINVTGSNGLSGMVTVVLGERNNTFINGNNLAYGNGASNGCLVAPVSGKIIAASSTYDKSFVDSLVTSITLGIEIGGTSYKPLPASQYSSSIEPHQYQSSADGLVDNSTTLTFQAGDTIKMTIEDVSGPTSYVNSFVGAIWLRYD